MKYDKIKSVIIQFTIVNKVSPSSTKVIYELRFC